MEHKNQHWIPRSYLKAWCDPERRDNLIHIYGADGVYRGYRPYTRIFSADNLYTVMDGTRRDLRTEKAFKLIEDHFLKVRRALERNTTLPAASQSALAWFVAAMHRRSPAACDQWQSFQDRIVKVGNGMEEALKKASPAERKNMVRASSLSSSGRSNSMTLEEARAAAAEPFGKWVLRHVMIEARLLQQMSLAILKAPPGLGFITSDNPVAWHDAAPSGQRRRHLGLGHRSIEVSMPLTPQYCLILDHSGSDGTGDATQAAVDEINSRTLHQCQTCFIARSNSLVVNWVDGEKCSLMTGGSAPLFPTERVL